jgi:competence protein ComEC
MAGLPVTAGFRPPDAFRRLARIVRRWRGALFADALADAPRAVLWLPAALGIGIAIYFSLPAEPPVWLGVLLALPLGVLYLLAMRRGAAGKALAIAFVFTVLAGFAMAGLRTALVAAPVLAERVGPVSVEGLVIETSWDETGARRLLIQPVLIEDLTMDDMPARLRVTVRHEGGPSRPGEWVRIPAVLMPPPAPAAPHGFDFARQAWFQRLGAVGFATAAPMSIPPPRALTPGERLRGVIAGLRYAMADRIRRNVPGSTGAVAAALVTGDRSGIAEHHLQALRDAGLAHLLAISGLHMAMVGGLIFFTVRAALALSERLALNYPIKKWAAVIALIGSLFYLLLSGASISTQRAFIMIAVAFFAILIDRPALTLRTVAVAAAIILLLTPESLLHAGFQMSFAAVIALVAAAETARVSARWQRWVRPDGPRGPLARFWAYVAGVAVTSVIAGLATAPFSAYHFNRFGNFDLIANVLAMPVMGALVMPMAVIASLAMPFGLDVWPLAPMGWGIEMVVGIATTVSSWPGAVTLMPAAPAGALGLVALGGLWLAIWQRGWRLAGLLPVCAGIILALTARPPDILIDRDAANLAVRGGDGRLSLLEANRSSYAAGQWLRRDGDPRSPEEALGGSGLRCDAVGCRLLAGRAPGRIAVFAAHPAALVEDCGHAALLISFEPVRRCPGTVVIDRTALSRHGAHAVWFTGYGMRIVHAEAARGRRPWAQSQGAQRQ